ncbi:phosphate signaling complex protein PhoU [Ornithinimicrobium sufpigmenti]|uniref:phosphate signaling complex protein PhoU n=1 Tax=Ornithinimicrobium sufpigmenti TaxID=2508882 RepID=UPI001036B540|nr:MULTISPECIES: phosphate signaling complex protein PhoU [unclassified Ornithinimicrobium]
MRSHYQEELGHINEQLVQMSGLAATALERATRSLMDADLDLAQEVISDDAYLDAVRRDVDNRAIDMLARQQPVATDLRQMVTTLRMSSDLERAGDLARHVAKLARLRYPSPALDEQLRPIFEEMSTTAIQMVRRAGEIVAASDAHGAAELMGADDTMDRLHREVFRILLDPATSMSAQATVDATLLSRYYERFADHAVSVALRVVYLVTGVWADEQLPGAHEHFLSDVPRSSG